MRRREFIKVIIGTAAAWPVTSRAQQSAISIVGFINAAAAQSYKQQLAAFLKGMEETGYIAGKNVMIEYRWAEDQNDQFACNGGRSGASSSSGDRCNQHPGGARS